MSSDKSDLFHANSLCRLTDWNTLKFIIKPLLPKNIILLYIEKNKYSLQLQEKNIVEAIPSHFMKKIIFSFLWGLT